MAMFSVSLGAAIIVAWNLISLVLEALLYVRIHKLCPKIAATKAPVAETREYKVPTRYFQVCGVLVKKTSGILFFVPSFRTNNKKKKNSESLGQKKKFRSWRPKNARYLPDSSKFVFFFFG